MQNPYLQQINQLSLHSQEKLVDQSPQQVSYESSNQKVPLSLKQIQDRDSYYIQTQSKLKDDLAKNNVQSQKEFLNSYDVENQLLEKHLLKQKRLFSTRLFLLLTLQQFFTCIIVTVAFYSKSFSDAFMNPDTQYPTVLFWCMLAITILIEIIVYFTKESLMEQETLIRYLVLVIFTISISIVITGASVICKSILGDCGVLMFMTSFMALIAMGSLFIYCEMSKQELDWKIASLFVFLSQLLMFLIFSIIFFKIILWVLLCSLLVTLFGMVLFLIQEKLLRFNIYDFVIGVIFIYIETSILILRIPECLVYIALQK